MSRPTARTLVLGVLAGIVVWIVAAVIVLARARSDALAGRAIVDDVRLRSTDVHAIADGSAEGELVRARTRFARARAGTGAWWLAPARALPVLGRQIRSAHALSSAAETLSDAALDAIGEAQAALDAPHSGGGGRLELIRRLRDIADGVAVRLRPLDLGPAEGLIASLAAARSELAEELSELHRTLGTVTRVADAATAMLRGPRRTLVLAANNAEMRAGTGTFLSLAILRTRDGELSLGDMRSVQTAMPEQGAVEVSGDVRARWGWLSPTNDWRTLMLSPHFGAQAPLAARMWEAAGKQPVAGVISIDPVGLRAVLRATGPVRVAGRTIGADDVLPELLYRQYVRFSSRSVERRRDALSGIARAAFAALDRGDWDPLELLDELADAARGRHLMVWSDDAGERSAWADAGIDGALEPGSIMVSVLNRGGNKLDRFLYTDATLSLEPDPEGTQGTLRVSMRNRTPADAPKYVAGPNAGHAQRHGEYVGILAVTLPGASGSATVDGGSRIVAVGADGPTRVVAAEFRIARGRARTLVVRFRFAAVSGEITVAPSARVPATRWSYGSERWSDTEPRVLRWGAG